MTPTSTPNSTPTTIDIYTQHVGILGTTGSGKSYAARGIVEAILTAGRGDRMVIIDPKGDWWGLRLASNGTDGSGHDFTVVGGPHADPGLRIDPESPHAMAAPLGKMLATTTSRVILDLSDLPAGKMRAFTAAVLAELYQHNRTPLYLVVDEADEFAPQSPKGEAAVSLGAMERIWKRGRQRGIRGWLISQRPASIHKDVLGMVQTLVCMKLTLPHDRTAIMDWMRDQDMGGVDPKDMVKSLPTMPRGTGWVWCPGHGVLAKHAFGRISTFDSMRTPEDGDTTIGVTLPPIETSQVAEALADSVREQVENDPKALRAKIAELEAEIDRKPVVIPRPNALELAEAERKGWNAGRIDGAKQMRIGLIAILNSMAEAHPEQNTPQGGSQGAEVCSGLDREDVQPGEAPGSEQHKSRTPEPPPQRQPSRESAREGGAIEGPLQKILDAIAWWANVGVDAPSRVQVAVVAGYTASGGTFTRYLSALSSKGMIVYPSKGDVAFTPGGKTAARFPDRVGTLRGLHEAVRGIIDGPHRKLMDVLLARRGHEMGRTELAELAGYEASGGTFNRYCSHLSSLGLIRYPKRTTVAAAKILFPEGVR